MARVVKSVIEPLITCNIDTKFTDGTIQSKVIKVGDVVENLRYLENQEIKSATGMVKAIKIKMDKPYPTIFSTDYDPFNEYIKANILVIDSSEKYDSKIVSVPVMEVIEDAGVINVERMNVSMSIAAKLTTTYTDGTEKVIDLKPGEMLSNVKIMNAPMLPDFKGTFKLVTFGLTIKDNIIKINSLVLKDDNGNIFTADINKILVIGDSVEVTVDTAVITEAIANSSAVALGVVKYEEGIEVSKVFTITGNNFGIPANKGDRAKNEISENESVLSGTLKLLSGADVVVDGVTLTGDALTTFKEAKSVEFKNVKFINVKPTVAKTMLMNNQLSDKATKVVIENCYFGTPDTVDGAGMYHIFELTGKLADGSSISNNHFGLGCCKHNQVNIYNVEDGATITVANNTFEYSGNAIRIGTKGDAHCTINISNNIYKSTDESDNGEWAGLLLVQPYGKETITMKHVKININKITNRTEYAQTMYAYMDDKTSVLTDDTMPEVVLDNRSFKMKILDYRTTK